MRRFGIFTFSVLAGAAAATLFVLAARRAGVHLEAVREAFLVAWWAGAAVGITVGAGAVLGPRPPLPPEKCLLSMARITIGTLAGGLLGSLIPAEFSAPDRALADLLARRGIALGSGIGAVAVTLLEMINVYRARRRADPRR